MECKAAAVGNPSENFNDAISVVREILANGKLDDFTPTKLLVAYESTEDIIVHSPKVFISIQAFVFLLTLGLSLLQCLLQRGFHTSEALKDGILLL